jgi:acetyl-CoA synthetase
VGDSETARSILEHVRGRVAPFKRIRRIEFAELPKTISGKIRRVELRRAEHDRPLGSARRANEYWEEDLAVAPPGTPAAKHPPGAAD